MRLSAALLLFLARASRNWRRSSAPISTLGFLRPESARRSLFMTGRDLRRNGVREVEANCHPDQDDNACNSSPLHEQDFFGFVNLRQLDFDYFVRSGLHVSADEGGLHRQFAMAAIDEHEKLNQAGTAMRKQGIERGARSAAGVEHVIH